ncbi:MAG: ABC transporter permease [Clostridiales Family XIII bacterium]|jgi:putative ABC transport system permease protein|nr:ABC transporter permease [Clostridiales Family XIII bacterium]
MRFADNFLEAIGSLRTNKMRSILTMLGVIIGITAVIAIMTIGSSMQGYLEDSMSGFGINNITVSLQSKNDEGPAFRVSAFPSGGGIKDDDLMTDEMLSDLKAQYPDEIKAFSISESVGQGQTVKGEAYANLALSGVNPEYATANSLTMARGRFISASDEDSRRRLAVVSDKLVSNMFGEENPLGKELTVQTQGHIDIYTIVGVYEYDDGGLTALMGASTSSDYDTSTDVYIPLSVAQRVNNSHGYQSFTIVAETGVNSTTFGAQAEAFLGRYYSRNEDYGISAFSMESIVEEVTSMLSTMSLAIAAIAAISLLVGGIGVMNIMMVSITERTREIGTRKAIGATNAEIRTQFIVEAVVICIVGGIIGIILGSILGAVGASLLEFPARASVTSILVSVGVSMAIGLFFGFYPANKAAKLDPIDALRYE